MKHFLLFLLITFSFFAEAQTANKIIIGTIDSLQSKILNEKRKIWVYVPDDYGNSFYLKQRYPVVYLLDGDAHFSSVVGMIEQLSSVNGNTICPQMIVVGIPNTNRMRDLTPTHVDADPPFIDANAGKQSGGGEKFISFIEKELIPHIDSLYPTQPYKTFIGHSLGGLMVMQTLIHHPKLFNAYVAIDPSMWWDHKKLLNQIKQVVAKQTYSGKSLFLGIANTMSPEMNVTKVQKDTTFDTNHIRSILELDKTLSQNKQAQLTYKSKYYGDDDHGSVPLITEYDALHFIFNYYPFKLAGAERQSISKSVIQKLENHYASVSKQFGYKVAIPERVANEMAYQALAGKHYEEAEYLFKLNTTNYPESFNTYDSLGDYYEVKGDKEKAIVSFKKALALKDFPETRKKLEKLEGK